MIDNYRKLIFLIIFSDYDGEDNYNEEDDENATDNEDEAEAGYTDEEEGEVSGGEESGGEESNGEETNEIPTSVTKDIPKNITTECGADRGGCDHVCKMIQLEYETESQIHCSCYPGFTLNESDGRSCIGKLIYSTYMHSGSAQ